MQMTGNFRLSRLFFASLLASLLIVVVCNRWDAVDGRILKVKEKKKYDYDGQKKQGVDDNDYNRKSKGPSKSKKKSKKKSKMMDEKNDDDGVEEDFKRAMEEDPAKIHKEVLLVGDSLLTVPDMFFNLSKVLSIKLCENHTEYECEVSNAMRGGLQTENMLELLPKKFLARHNIGIALPDAVVIHSNSEKHISEDRDRARLYEENLVELIKFLKTRVPYILIISPGLFTPQGEMPEHWEDPMLHSTLKVISRQEKVCRHFKIACINLRNILKDKILEAVKLGETPKDLQANVGNKKEWIKQVAEGVVKNVTTWDYPGSGGMYTFDGEHLNNRGTEILILEILSQFNKWPFFDGNQRKPRQDILENVVLPSNYFKDIKEETMEEENVFGNTGIHGDKTNDFGFTVILLFFIVFFGSLYISWPKVAPFARHVLSQWYKIKHNDNLDRSGPSQI